MKTEWSDELLIKGQSNGNFVHSELNVNIDDGEIYIEQTMLDPRLPQLDVIGLTLNDANWLIGELQAKIAELES